MNNRVEKIASRLVLLKQRWATWRTHDANVARHTLQFLLLVINSVNLVARSVVEIDEQLDLRRLLLSSVSACKSATRHPCALGRGRMVCASLRQDTTLSTYITQYSTTQHNIPEHNIPEHNIQEHHIQEHNIQEHNIQEHNIQEHNIQENTYLNTFMRRRESQAQLLMTLCLHMWEN